MNCGGLPLSVLHLKIGAPVMLLRNLYPLYGLMTILHASNQMPGGAAEWWVGALMESGEKRLIYRTKLTSNETDFHFQLTQFQFPVRLAFAMTIKKSSPWPTLALSQCIFAIGIYHHLIVPLAGSQVLSVQ